MPEKSNGADAKKRILIADDDQTIRSLLAEFLKDEGFETFEARTGGEVLRSITQLQPDLLILDYRMPEWDGIEVMRRLREQDIQVPVLLMTAYGTASASIQATQLGADLYITKPFELEDVLFHVRRVFEKQALASEVRKLRSRLEHRDVNERIIGNSPSMQQIYRTIGLVAQSEAAVLITGETGTGKELVAETIHHYSAYRAGPLVKVNCAALPETLLESELFGHEKGSFTGALAQKKGRFELAHKGTIFLDEIGEISLNTQKKLLRVLQEKEFERVGGTVPVKVDCRVIAATNKNLAREVTEGRFREDLYYRLNVVTIHTPPLRERKEDIPALVEHFLHKYRYTAGSAPARISEAAMAMLLEHEWPGNVRELEHTVQRAVVMARGGVITPEHLTIAPAREQNFVDIEQRLNQGASLAEVVADVEARMIGAALERARQNRHHAARALGMDVETLERKMREYGIQ